MSQQAVDPAPPPVEQSPVPTETWFQRARWGLISLLAMGLFIGVYIFGFSDLIPNSIGVWVGRSALLFIPAGLIAGIVGRRVDRIKWPATIGVAVHGLFVALIVCGLVAVSLAPPTDPV